MLRPDEDRPSEAPPPLCVGLEGTLIHTDLLYESLLVLLMTKPWLVLLFVPWLLRGKAFLKAQVFRHARLDVTLLPYDQRVVAFLAGERKRGRRVVLATASFRPIAEAVADHLGLFDEVIAAENGNILRGAGETEALAYLGNDRSEIDIPRREGRVRAAIKAVRPYQWCKNLLVFVPIVTSNHLNDWAAWLAGLAAFIAFSATASGIYVLNDLTDLAADRAHPRKCKRPFASGMLPITAGLVLAPLLLAAGLGLGWSRHLLPMLTLYAAASILYSLRVKELPLVDVFVLASLYVIRLFAGGLATGYHLSLWLLGFSLFLFLALALIKRVGELNGAEADDRRISRRGYAASDFMILKMMGVSSSFAASVLLALYVQSAEVAARYATPALLWALVPLSLFWQLRLWLSTTRGYMQDDPIVYSAGDWVSWVVSATVIVIMAAASQTYPAM